MTQTTKQPISDELILVVKRSDLFPHNSAPQGLVHTDLQPFMHTIQEKKEFLPRSMMETDPTYKQIIPYLIFNHGDRYFLMQRHAQASETRLRSKYTFGIGGHVRQEDMQTNSLFEWAQREFHEEVSYHDGLTINPIGILNDDSNAVGKVHVGLVLLATGNTDDIIVKSELESGMLLTLDEAAAHRESMESWSQMIFDFLRR